MSLLDKLVGLRPARPPLSVCSIIGCHNSTRNPHHENPRFRWIVGLELVDDDGEVLKINLCPHCIPDYFEGVNEEFFKKMDFTERLIKLQNETGTIQ
jgi:hypothetical protein